MSIRDKTKISIHTPTKGATAQQREEARLQKISIHTPTKGATFRQFRRFFLNLFQSTLPQRERPSCLIHLLCLFFISIHTPTKGATTLAARKESTVRFQSTLPQRERLGSFGKIMMTSGFQSTLPQRERQQY